MNLPKFILKVGKRDFPTKVTLKKYDLSEGDYRLLAQSQNYRCALCLRLKPLCIDHDHKLKGRAAVRGLLCAFCNGIVGCWHDDAAKFDRAAAYLRRPKVFS